MRKAFNLFGIAVLLAAIGLFMGGCDNPANGGTTGGNNGNAGGFEQFFAPAFNNNSTGSTIVANNTPFDMLLFRGEALTTGNIVAGVRAGVPSTRINLSNETNYNVGGWVVLRAVRASAFEADGMQARVDHSVMATFRQGTETTVSIVSTTDGGFQFVVHNMSNQFALQLRENSPTGRVVAFLTRGEQNRVINTPSAEQILLHPVWIGFSTQTMSIVEFAPTEDFSAQQAIPSQPGVGLTHNMHFPWQGAAPISFPVRAPAAVIRVQNNFDLAVTFRTSTSPHHAIDAPETILGTGIIPGDWRSFSMETAGTGGLNLNIFLQGGNVAVPVRFAGSDQLPIIEAGYYYLVTFRHLTGEPLGNPASYEALISRTRAIDTAGVIQAP